MRTATSHIEAVLMHLANSLESLATAVSILSKFLNMLTSVLITFFYAHPSPYYMKDVVWILHR
jgi:hypothetical protein